MRRLAIPQHSMAHAADACAEGIVRDAGLRAMLLEERPRLVKHEARYVAHAGAGQLFAIAPNPDPDDAAIAVGRLSRANMKALYTQFFVPARKPGRGIYDALMLAAKEQCPFCGGIGEPANLDHFLPKEHFPQFSVLPVNLVPACRDCNMGEKGAAYAREEAQQTIHPYLDKQCFFVDRWIDCDYHAESLHDAGVFVYRATPPAHWQDIDKKRACAHFVDFDIARRYGVKAAEQLVTVLAQVRNLRAYQMPMQDVVQAILRPAVEKAPFLNHWQAGMYTALAQWCLVTELV